MNRGFWFWLSMTAAALVIAGAGLASAEVTTVDGGVEFRYEDASAGSVNLAGDFNGWSTTATPMTRDGNVWSVVMDLTPGTYEYKFVVNGSDWIADPDNPKVVGAYGNSQVVVDENGEVVMEGGTQAISNTRVNSRVMLNGWYRATYNTQSDVPDDPRWRLSRPNHEVYVSVKPTVTPQVSGDATVRIATGAGDIKEISADFYSGDLIFKGGPFSVMGYYNEERIQFDDPLESIGHRDLIGSIAEEHIPFGRGSQGVILDMDIFGAGLRAVYANQYDEDITNKPSIYDNTDTDLLAGRLKREFGPVMLGATYVSWRDGWWMDWTGTNYSPAIEAYVDSTGSTSDWFELADSEDIMGLDFALPLLDDKLTLRAEAARYAYDSRWDMGNHEKVEGEAYSNGAIDVEAGTMDGVLGVGVVEVSPVPLVDLRLEYQMFSSDGMKEGEEYTGFEGPRWLRDYPILWATFTPETAIRNYTEVRYDASPLVVYVWDALPQTDIGKLEFDGALSFGIIDLGLEFDWRDYDLVFTDPLTGEIDSTAYEMTEWTGSSMRLAGRARANILPDRLWLEFEAENWSHDEDPTVEYDGESEPEVSLYNEFGIYDRFETVLRGRYEFTENWSAMADVRFISYDVPSRTAVADSVDRVSDETEYTYETESFFEPYVAIIYSPRENVELRLSYGVNPLTYVDTPVEGRANGREVWRENYLWDHSAYDMLDAEKALEDARTIGLMAVITF